MSGSDSVPASRGAPSTDYSSHTEQQDVQSEEDWTDYTRQAGAKKGGRLMCGRPGRLAGMQLSAPAIPSSHQMVPHTRTIAPTGKSFGTSTGRFPTDYWTTGYEVPGPGEYSREVKSEESPSHSKRGYAGFASRAPRFKRMLKGPAHLVAGPGPNQYFSDDDPRSFLYKRPVQPQFYQPATPKREHSKPKDEPVLPGPGTYEPSLLPEKPATKSVFLSETKRGFETIPNMNPGPGAYEAAHPGDYYESYSYAYPFSSTEPRREPFTPLKPIKEAPGPNAYDVVKFDSDKKQLPPRPIKGNTIVPVQIPKDNIPAIPGPGAYDVAEPETKKKMQSAFVSATQRNYDDLTETLSHPGPERYKPRVQPKHSSFHTRTRWSTWL